jgi:hypothetical protein
VEQWATRAARETRAPHWAAQSRYRPNLALGHSRARRLRELRECHLKEAKNDAWVLPCAQPMPCASAQITTTPVHKFTACNFATLFWRPFDHPLPRGLSCSARHQSVKAAECSTVSAARFASARPPTKERCDELAFNAARALMPSARLSNGYGVECREHRHTRSASRGPVLKTCSSLESASRCGTRTIQATRRRSRLIPGPRAPSTSGQS